MPAFARAARHEPLTALPVSGPISGQLLPLDPSADDFIFRVPEPAELGSGSVTGEPWDAGAIAAMARLAGGGLADERGALLWQDEAQTGLFHGGFEPDPRADEFMFDHLAGQDLV